MVTYQVQLPDTHQEAFLNLIRSLQSLGVVTSFHASDNLTQPGASTSIEQLLEILNESEKQVAAGQVIPAQDVIACMKAWKKANK